MNQWINEWVSAVGNSVTLSAFYSNVSPLVEGEAPPSSAAGSAGVGDLGDLGDLAGLPFDFLPGDCSCVCFGVVTTCTSH
jgi:hypothetical protein